MPEFSELPEGGIEDFLADKNERTRLFWREKCVLARESAKKAREFIHATVREKNYRLVPYKDASTNVTLWVIDTTPTDTQLPGVPRQVADGLLSRYDNRVKKAWKGSCFNVAERVVSEFGLSGVLKTEMGAQLKIIPGNHAVAWGSLPDGRAMAVDYTADFYVSQYPNNNPHTDRDPLHVLAVVAPSLPTLTEGLGRVYGGGNWHVFVPRTR